MPSKLDQLRTMTDVVADTGDIEAIRRFEPLDATTNPSLLLKAAALPHYASLLDNARAWAISMGGSDAEQLANCCDRFAVDVGREILQIVPGRVSTEVDARLSFDTNATIARAQKLIGLYEDEGVGRERILIKIASTWEGIQAARVLEAQGVNCNLTLLFGFAQAAACADAGVFLISPFVGRILDWYKANTAITVNCGAEDPGVQSVTRIYHYYKQHGYNTVVMGASFRNTGEIEALAGCDRLTVSPQLLQELSSDQGDLPRHLDAASARTDEPRRTPTETDFRFELNADAMATEKLAEGIRRLCSGPEKTRGSHKLTMINALKSLFEHPERESDDSRQYRVKLAAAALLIETARADFTQGAEEEAEMEALPNRLAQPAARGNQEFDQRRAGTGGRGHLFVRVHPDHQRPLLCRTEARAGGGDVGCGLCRRRSRQVRRAPDPPGC